MQDLIGNKFGRLTVLEYLPGSHNKSAKCKCLCECGQIKIYQFGNLKRGTSRSCGCLRTEMKRQRLKTNPISVFVYDDYRRSAMVVWRNAYNKELPFEKFIELSKLNCTYC